MVDQEVANILAEIRQRVTAANGLAESGTPETPAATISTTATPPVSVPSPVNGNGYAGLSVLARAWDRLPPVVSNRSGYSANLELWFKEKLKRAFRWFTWEQVNFNAATHHTLREVIEALESLDQKQTFHRQEMYAQQATRIAEIKENRKLIEEQQIGLQSQQLDLNAQQHYLKEQQAELLEQRSSLVELRNSLNEKETNLHNTIAALDNALRQSELQNVAELKARLSELADEFRGRDERLLDEERVSFKQLTLELSESQVLQDRARRELDVRLTELERERTSDAGD